MSDEQWPRDALSGAVYAERDGKILLLKRAGGAGTGLWFLPGGAMERGETPEDAARRELEEEAGLVPTGPLVPIGCYFMHVYNTDSYQFTYAAPCDEGEVVLSDEHSAFRWADPQRYREQSFTDELIEQVAAGNQAFGDLVRAIRDDLDKYITWRAGP